MASNIIKDSIMNSLLKRSLQIEYETTALSIADLCFKHNIAQEDLGDTSKWKKLVDLVADKETELIEHPPDIMPVTPDEVHTSAEQIVMAEIQKTGKLILSSAQDMLANSYGELTPRDLKELSVTLASVRESILGKAQPNITVNTQINTIASYAREKLATIGRDC